MEQYKRFHCTRALHTCRIDDGSAALPECDRLGGVPLPVRRHEGRETCSDNCVDATHMQPPTLEGRALNHLHAQKYLYVHW